MSKPRLRVLLIEDDEEDYLLVRDLLSAAPTEKYDLEWVSTYDRALEVIGLDRHDVFLLDYRLGGESGIDLLREAAARRCKAPFIMLTGLENYETAIAAMRAGAFDYLIKGQISTQLLERSIRYALERKQAEQALRRSEEKYRELIEHAGSIIVRIDAKGNITFFNEFAQNFLGYREEEVLGRNIVGTIIPKTDSAGRDLSAMIQDILRHPERYERNENENMCRDGKRVWVSWANRAITDDTGRMIGMLCIGNDITERKRAEEALRESEERFRGMFEKTLAVKLLIDPETGRIVEANPAAGKFYGYRLKELKEMFISDINTLSEGEVIREMAQAVLERRNHFFFRHRLASGELRDVEVHSSPIDFQGQRLLYSIIYDITSLKRTENALRESEEKHRTIFEHSPLGIVHFDQNGIITACNDKVVKILDSSQEKLVGFNLRTSLQDVKMKGCVTKCLSGKSGYYESTYHSLTGGKTTPIKADFSPILSEDGSVLGGIGIIEDISARKAAEDALRESEKRLRLLSSKLLSAQEEERKRIARELHDSIGSGLSAVKFSLEGMLGQAEQGVAAQEKLKTLISITQTAIEEARRIMTDLRPSILDDLGIIVTIGWFARRFQTIYPAICIEERIGIQEDEIPEALKISIFRVIQEALNNSAKYSKANRVNLSLTRKEGTIELAIEDNGVGFELKSSFFGNRRGRGLGLTSMKERIELSGGTFSIHSAPGEGTRIQASWLSEPQRCARN